MHKPAIVLACLASLAAGPAFAQREARARPHPTTPPATTPAAPATTFNAASPGASGYTVYFTDTFAPKSGSSLPDQTKWETDWWYDNPDACTTAWLPGSATTSTKGLHLHIQSLESYKGCPAGSYSNAHLDAFDAVYRQTGYWEATITAATGSNGPGGTLTAWWLLPNSGDWPPEIDTTEIRGDTPVISYMTNHYGSQNNAKQGTYGNSQPLSAGQHKYGVLVTASTISFYFDGVQKFSTPLQAGQATNWFPILSLYTGDCGDGWAGCPKQKTGWSADAYVQSVTVWAPPKGQ